MTVSRLFATVAVCSLALSALLLFAGCGQPESSERIKLHLDAYLRAWNTGDFNGLEEVSRITYIPQCRRFQGQLIPQS